MTGVDDNLDNDPNCTAAISHISSGSGESPPPRDISDSDGDRQGSFVLGRSRWSTNRRHRALGDANKNPRPMGGEAEGQLDFLL